MVPDGGGPRCSREASRRPPSTTPRRGAARSARDAAAARCSTMTTLAGSGHPGGSFSSMEILLTLYHFARLRPDEPALARAGPHRREPRPHLTRRLRARSPTPASSTSRTPSRTSARPARRSRGTWSGRCPASSGRRATSARGSRRAWASRSGPVSPARGWHTFVAHERRRAEQGAGRRGAPPGGEVRPRGPDRGRRLQRRADLRAERTRSCRSTSRADFAADGWDVVEVDGHDVRALYAALARGDRRPHAPARRSSRTRTSARRVVHGRTATSSTAGRSPPSEYARGDGRAGAARRARGAREARARRSTPTAAAGRRAAEAERRAGHAAHVHPRRRTPTTAPRGAPRSSTSPRPTPTCRSRCSTATSPSPVKTEGVRARRVPTASSSAASRSTTRRPSRGRAVRRRPACSRSGRTSASSASTRSTTSSA